MEPEDIEDDLHMVANLLELLNNPVLTAPHTRHTGLAGLVDLATLTGPTRSESCRPLRACCTVREPSET